MFEIDELANQKEKSGIEIIRMTLGKTELPLHKDILDVMKNAIDTMRLNNVVIPAGLPDLKQKISEYYKDKMSICVCPSNILIGSGTSFFFRNLLSLLLSHEDEILLPKPYYSLYHFCSLLTEASIKFYDINDDLSINMSSFESNFNLKTKVVIINSPGNPLGNIISYNELNRIDEIVNGNAYIISDEIYNDIYFDEKPISFLELQNPRSTFFITNGFSKGYRMYTKRIGYCIVPDEFIEKLSVILQHTMLTVDPVNQFGAIQALNLPEEVESIRKLYLSRRDYATIAFQKLENVLMIKSKGSFYITLNCSNYINKNPIKNCLELAKDILNKTNVAVVPGVDFGLPNTLRLSFTTSKFEEGINRLVNFFKGEN